MNTKLMLIEFSVLIAWVLAYVSCTAIHKDPGIGVATAFSAFVAASAVKVTFGGKGDQQ